MKNTTLCYIKQNNKYLMLHRTKKSDDPNEGKWIGIGGHMEYMHLFTADKIEGAITDNCEEGELEWIESDKVMELCQMLSKTNKCDCSREEKVSWNLPLDKGHFITGGYYG